MNIQIDTALSGDRQELREFYTRTISDTFRNNGINDSDGLSSEIENQMKTFENPEDFIMLARINGKIIGTIAYGTMNKSVSSNIPEELKQFNEIKGVYIHPDFQNRGIGSFLWKTMIAELQNRNVVTACLDSGYKLSQKYWKKKIGEPTYFLKDYWGAGEHQLIWFFNLNTL